MYRINQRVKYSEVGVNKKVNMSQIVNYFQDCSTFNSEDIGLGINYLKESYRAWILVSWQIIVDRYPKFGENISIGTWAYGFSRLQGFRNFDIIDENNIRIAKANSLWVFVDTITGHPTKITDDCRLPYGNDEKLKMDYLPRKIEVLKENSKILEEFKIPKMCIDTNGHVNNEKYIEIAEEYLPNDFVIKQMRADYRKSALLGDIIIPKVSYNDNIYTIELLDNENNPYVIIEFSRLR